MAAVSTEAELKDKAIRYLKSHYGEDTVRMDVKNNGVETGDWKHLPVRLGCWDTI